MNTSKPKRRTPWKGSSKHKLASKRQLGYLVGLYRRIHRKMPPKATRKKWQQWTSRKAASLIDTYRIELGEKPRRAKEPVQVEIVERPHDALATRFRDLMANPRA